MPLRLMMRARIRPFTPVSTGVLTHSFALGVTGAVLCQVPGTAVAPALSPCQPLLNPMSPWARRSELIVILPPRFGTSCHISPLALDMSRGLTMKKVATYSTLPFVFASGFPMSVMRRLCELFGSNSPNARPVMVS